MTNKKTFAYGVGAAALALILWYAGVKSYTEQHVEQKKDGISLEDVRREVTDSISEMCKINGYDANHIKDAVDGFMASVTPEMLRSRAKLSLQIEDFRAAHIKGDQSQAAVEREKRRQQQEAEALNAAREAAKVQARLEQEQEMQERMASAKAKLQQQQIDSGGQSQPAAKQQQQLPQDLRETLEALGYEIVDRPFGKPMSKQWPQGDGQSSKPKAKWQDGDGQ
jgi:cysteinyl-tRNA synthetase